MPQPEAERTDNPEVTMLLMAHEVAKLAAAGEAAGRPTLNPDAYLAAFGKIYRGIAAVVSEPRDQRQGRP